MRGILLVAILLLPVQAYASEWVFSDAIAVTKPDKTGIFHYMKPSDRKNIASSGSLIQAGFRYPYPGPAYYVRVRRSCEDHCWLNHSSGNVARFE